MAVTVQSGSIATAAGAMTTIGTPSYRDIACTIASGSETALFVIITSGSLFEDAYWQVPQFNGADMTLITFQPWTLPANSYTAVYIMLAPSVGAGTVRVRESTNTGRQLVTSCVAFDGVDQTTPYGTTVSYSNSAASSPISSSVTVASGGVALAGFGTANGGSNIHPAFAAGQTSLQLSTIGAMDGGHSYKADATAMGFTVDAGTYQLSQLVVPINPGSGGGGGATSLLPRRAFPRSILNF